jgi:signal transduction histidine kinase
MLAKHLSLGTNDAGKEQEAAGRSAWGLVGVFLLLAAAIALAGWLYLSHRQTATRDEVHWNLAAIADLKLNQIANWREERLSDARFFSRARFVALDIRRLLDQPDSPPAREAVSHWLGLLKSDDRYYAALVLDTHFHPLLALPAAAPDPTPSARASLEAALQRRQVIISDLLSDPTNGPIHLDVAFPIFEGADLQRGTPLALVLLELDARKFLFPLIRSWPTPSHTAETLLVRCDGDDVVFLNDLRHRPASAMAFRLPLSLPELPAAKVLRGDTNVLQGIDYRSVPVVAAGRLIPGTPWAMVSKIDRDEIYAPLRRETLAALAVLGTLLLAAALLVSLLWWRNNSRLLQRDLSARKAHEREIERMNRLYAAQSQVNQAVVRATSRDDLLQCICRALVHSGGFQMAWVGWVDQASSRIVVLAQVGDDADNLQRLQLFADDRPENQSPVTTAIRTSRPCLCDDLVEAPQSLQWHAAAARSGWRSLAAFPIHQQGHICGALVVYARQKDFFGPQEQRLLEEAAEDVSFGLDTLLNDQRRKKAENQLREAGDELVRANTALDQKVKERTAQLAEANANLQTFAYTAAHDLRSPLRAIKGFSTILLEECKTILNSDSESLLNRIGESADQMAHLLNDLLEYSKLSGTDLHLVPVHLQQAVAQAVALLETDIRATNAAIAVSDSMPKVIGHPATLTLLINNLLSNALKFVPQGARPEIRIRTEVTSQSPGGTTETSQTDNQESKLENGMVRLWVEDNGIGIASQHLGRIFNVFQRLHGKHAYPGTGLGLAIVRKGIERMGGRVGVESELGRGSRFWFELALAAPETISSDSGH